MAPKERTPYNDIDLWRAYCARLRRHGWPKSSRDAMQVTMPEIAAKLEAIVVGVPTWREMGVDLPEWDEEPYDAEGFAETRVPFARADSLMRKAAKLKTPPAKLRHLEAALTWTEYPHPWQGPKTARQLGKTRNAIVRLIKQLE